MAETTIKKVNVGTSPAGEMGQKYLVSGKNMAMRLWEEEPTDEKKQPSERDYETIGFVLKGKAELELEGQTLQLEPGDSWLVPAEAEHTYSILEPFTAIEATCPPARIHGRDE